MQIPALAHPPRASPPVASAVLALLLVAALSACTPFWSKNAKEASERQAIKLQELQLKVMRFADEYNGALADPLNRFSTQAISPEERLLAQTWRLNQVTAAYTIASGPNPLINCLDMIVLATLSREVLEDPAVDELHGQRGTALLRAHQELETRSWRLVDGTLNFDQITQLQAIMKEWRALHPDVKAVAQIRFADFAEANKKSAQASDRSGSNLFSLIGLDPFRSIDPAVREIEQTRVLAERSIYYLQRAPNLLDMEVERLVYQMAVMPETKQTLANADRVGLAAAALGSLSENAPEIIARERHAIVQDLNDTLAMQQKTILQLLVETRGVLQSGTEASESLHKTVQQIDSLIGRFQDRPRPAPDGTGVARRPFDINDYANAVREVSTSAEQLRQLLSQLTSSTASVQGLTTHTIAQVHRLVDRIFWLCAVLIALACVAVLGSVLTYRFVARRALS